MDEEQRFQAWLMTKGPDGRPVWAPQIQEKPGWRQGQAAHFLMALLKEKGISRR